MKMPVLDKNFYPMYKALEDFDAQVKASGKSVAVTLVAERSGGYNYVYTYDAFQDGVNDQLNFRVAERLAKTILWVVGGFKISVAGMLCHVRCLSKPISVQDAIHHSYPRSPRVPLCHFTQEHNMT